ncbi:MAG: helix-turn-helix transcriptional regulator [Aerococcus sp.]|nr:helix-turn-helix transcriptional regulator [Aerococcus sp.]
MSRGRGELTPLDKRIMKTISQNINTLLEQQKVTQAELSKKTGIPKSTLTSYVKGTSLPVVTNITKIARFFGLEVSDIDPRFKQPSEIEAQLLLHFQALSVDQQQLVITYVKKIEDSNR